MKTIHTVTDLHTPIGTIIMDRTGRPMRAVEGPKGKWDDQDLETLLEERGPFTQIWPLVFTAEDVEKGADATARQFFDSPLLECSVIEQGICRDVARAVLNTVGENQ